MVEPSAELTFLGGLSVRQADGNEITFPTRKARHLLVFLASPPGRSHLRDKLIGLFWSDRAEEQARGSLRNALSALRKTLGKDALNVDRDTVTLMPDAVSVDALTFEQLVGTGTEDALSRAAAMYAGDFLEGMATDQPVFEDWISYEQARFRALAQNAFLALIDQETRNENYPAALDTAQKLLALDPLQEEAHRILMRLYAASGQRSMALRQYEKCRRLLAEELDVKPTTELERLAQEVKRLEPEAFRTSPTTAARNRVDEPAPNPADSDNQQPDASTAAEEMPLTLPAKPAIAVLPFENMSRDPEQEYFADGMTEDIITALAAWRSFPVIARNSTFAYKGKSPDVRKVASDLGARYVLEGSVRRADKRLRITVQLIDAATGHHILAERFDRDLGDIFDLQDEIAQRIAARVQPQLEQAEQKRSAAKKPKSLDAWDFYQRGMALLYQFTKEGNVQARKMFARSIELEPTYSQPHVGLAYSHQLDILMEFTDAREDSLDKLFKTARQAVALDDSDSMAHVMLCFACRWAGKHDIAIAEAEKAVELNPSNAFAHFHLGNVLDLAGNPEEGIANMEKGLKLNPRDPRMHFLMSVMARAHFNAHCYEDAVEWARRSIHNRPDHPRAHTILAISLAHLDRQVEARAALDECEDVRPGFAKRWALLRQYRKPADNEHILEGLRKAGLPE